MTRIPNGQTRHGQRIECRIDYAHTARVLAARVEWLRVQAPACGPAVLVPRGVR
jgi:hypothetical protein